MSSLSRHKRLAYSRALIKIELLPYYIIHPEAFRQTPEKKIKKKQKQADIVLTVSPKVDRGNDCPMRNVYDVDHPQIKRTNITNYKINPQLSK